MRPLNEYSVKELFALMQIVEGSNPKNIHERKMRNMWQDQIIEAYSDAAFKETVLPF